MNNIKNNNKTLFICFFSICMLVCVCNIGFIKSTMAGFGSLTGQLTAKYSIDYNSNFPLELELSEEVKTDIVENVDYIIGENSFIIEGYEFIGWNTSIDGTGDAYVSGDEIKLEKNIILFAQWKKIDVVVISYGDVNLDGIISEDDYLLIEQHISLEKTLEGQSLLNADVNEDGLVDLVDVDIIKHVCLGTDGYVGMLPDKPILVYEIYNDNVADEEENNNESSSENNNGNQPSGDMSGNNGSSSNGSSSNGTGSSNNSSSGSSSNNSSSGSSSSNSSVVNGNKPSSDETLGNNKNDDDDLIVNDSNDDKEENNSDESVSEKDDVDENSNLTINDSNDNIDNDEINIYPLIIVFCICLIAFRLIIYVIKRFNEKNNFDKGNFK